MKAKSKSSSQTQAQSKSKSNSNSPEYGVEKSKLAKFFEDSLKDIYWAEKALTTALPKMAKKATSKALVEAITMHLEETKSQLERLDQVFEIIGKKARGKKCEAMAGLIKEAEGIIDETDEGAMRDAGIISASQKIEHYEIATYGTLRTYATILGHTDAADILEEILDEEKSADIKLSEVASEINLLASEEEED